MINELIEIGFAALPALGGGIAWKVMSDKSEKKRLAKYEPKIIDGRTENEWYELIRDMGKEDYERLTAGVIDLKEDENGEYSLERNPEYGWDTKKCMGERNHDKLMREWYPERFCKLCGMQCHDKCWQAVEARQEKEHKDRLRKAIAARQEKHEIEWAKVKEAAQTKPDPKVGTHFTMIRYLGTGLSGWRITHNGKELMMGKTEVKKYQNRHGLLMDGILGKKTQDHMKRQLRMGISLTEEGPGTWDYYRVSNKPHIAKVVYTLGKDKVTEEVLFESLADLMPLVKEKLERKMRNSQSIIKQPPKPDPWEPMRQLEQMMRENERRIREMDEHIQRKRSHYNYNNKYGSYDLEW